MKLIELSEVINLKKYEEFAELSNNFHKLRTTKDKCEFVSINKKSRVGNIIHMIDISNFDTDLNMLLSKYDNVYMDDCLDPNEYCGSWYFPVIQYDDKTVVVSSLNNPYYGPYCVYKLTQELIPQIDVTRDDIEEVNYLDQSKLFKKLANNGETFSMNGEISYENPHQITLTSSNGKYIKLFTFSNKWCWDVYQLKEIPISLIIENCSFL